LKNNKLIGITGGIGAGKSIVCNIFNHFHIPVFNADDTAKKLVITDPTLKAEIMKLFGNEAYINGVYNKKYIAGLVFNDNLLLTKLNNLIHPKVRQTASDWAMKQYKSPYLLYEAALMNAAGAGNDFEKVIVVQSPMEMRIKHIQNRDNRSLTEIKAIIDKQISDEERVKFADYQIINNEKISLVDQVFYIHNELNRLYT
jgi:dephospho-CoA kinase